MFYKKPKDVRYTDMAIWIDENAHLPDCDDEKLFEYLYLILVMLAMQNRDFKTDRQYDDFGIFGATYMYFRYLTKRKKIEQQEDLEEEPFKYRIKGCLNYIKSILPYIRILFQKETIENYKSKKERDEEELNKENYIFSDELSQIVDEIALCDFRMYLDDIPKTARNFMRTLPIKKNSFEWENLYISVLLTLINQMTLTKKLKELLFSQKGTKNKHPEFIHNCYEQMRQNQVILYRTDPSKENYIRTIVREIRHVISRDVSEMADVYIPSDDRLAIEIETQLMGDDDYGDNDAGD